MTLVARTMTQEDIPACLAILNATIAVGETTAHEEPSRKPN